MSLSPVHLLRERGSYQASMYMYKNLAPMPGHPLVNGNKRKTALLRKRNCCPCALEVTNLNAVASNLPRTCFKSQSLPDSVIFITELHLHVFLALCSSSNSGKPFEPDGRLQSREVPDRLWITKITYLIVGTNKLQRILPRI